MRRKRSTADTASARAPQTTYEPNQVRELVKVALLASAFIGAYATGAALSPVVEEPAPAAPPPPPPPPPHALINNGKDNIAIILNIGLIIIFYEL